MAQGEVVVVGHRHPVHLVRPAAGAQLQAVAVHVQHDAGRAAAGVDVDLGDRQEGERLVRGALHLQLGGELDAAARRLRRQQAVAALVLRQVVDHQGVALQPRGVLAARPAEPVAGLRAQVAAPGVGAQATVDVAPGHQHAAVAELLGVGAVKRERQHFGGRPWCGRSRWRRWPGSAARRSGPRASRRPGCRRAAAPAPPRRTGSSRRRPRRRVSPRWRRRRRR